MTGKARDAELRHPETVAFLESLTDEQTAKRLPLVRERDGVVARYWREGGRVRCREVAAEASVGSSSEMEAVLLHEQFSPKSETAEVQRRRKSIKMAHFVIRMHAELTEDPRQVDGFAFSSRLASRYH